ALTVADGEAKQFNVLVPLARSSNYPKFSARVSGFGMDGGNGRVHFSSGYSGHSTPFLPAMAMSDKLAQVNWMPLKGILPNLNGSPFGPYLLSATSGDW